MWDYIEENRAVLQKWIWKHCPFCSSKIQPTIPTWKSGGYQEEIGLKCPECGKSIKFITDWSPIVDFPLVNEIPEMIQDVVCPYFSIQKREDDVFLLRCCSRSIRECFGRKSEDCYSYHYTKLKEYFESGDYEKASIEADATIKLWKKEHPEMALSLGTYELIEIKYKALGKTDWSRWVNKQIAEAEKSQDFGSAAWIAWIVAESFEQPDFWRRSSQLFNNYVDKLKTNLRNDGYWERKNKEKEIAHAEAVSLEALSEVDEIHKAELLRLAGDKWLELYKLSGDPFSHPNFIWAAYHFRTLALAEPKAASEYYMKAAEFLLSKLDELQYPKEKLYYGGHGKFFLCLHYLSRANFIDDEVEKISLLEKSVEVLDEAISVHQKIGLDTANARALLSFVKSIICVEKFSQDETNFELINEATKHLEAAKTHRLSHKNVEIVDALIGSYKEALSAVKKPKQAIWLIAQARKKLYAFIQLLPNLSIGHTPMPNLLDSQKYYLSLYLDTIAKNVTSFAGKALSFNNICSSLEEFRVLVEKQMYPAFEVTEKPREETGRSLVQALFCGSFPQANIQFREVPVAEGKSDNMLIVSNEKYPFEVKIWRGDKYHLKGLEQIKYYMNYENVQFGFYLIFDPRFDEYKSGGEIIEYGSKRIYQIFIHIKPRRP
jgi:hypothetical protein